MKEEKFLVKYNERIFSKISKFIKRLFSKFIKKAENEKQKSSYFLLDDMETLKNIMDGKIEIENLENDQKKRLLNLCNNRIDEVHKKTIERKMENSKIEKLLTQINDL